MKVTQKGDRMFKGIKIIAISAVLMVISACETQYTYTPPETQDGKNCVMQCQNNQTQCKGNEQQRAYTLQQECMSKSNEANKQCEIESQADYNACIKYARTDFDRTMCTKKVCTKDSCGSSANFSFCEGEFRGCYQQCGGKVGIMK